MIFGDHQQQHCSYNGTELENKESYFIYHLYFVCDVDFLNAIIIYCLSSPTRIELLIFIISIFGVWLKISASKHPGTWCFGSNDLIK